ncbi:hypothetical protein Gotri_007562, partial [Gossypium trilobum]|nr:hypothetical protein [Gossypium trilobum]
MMRYPNYGLAQSGAMAMGFPSEIHNGDRLFSPDPFRLHHGRDRVFYESLCKELQKKFFQQRCELGRIARQNMKHRLNLNIPQNNTFLLPRDILAAMDRLIGMKFGMGTLDDMNHLKNKRIRSVADLLQNQFGLAL